MSLANAILTVLALLAVATIPSVVGNLMATWIARRWAAREQDRRLALLMRTVTRCPHLRNPALCDECNNNPKGT